MIYLLFFLIISIVTTITTKANVFVFEEFPSNTEREYRVKESIVFNEDFDKIDLQSFKVYIEDDEINLNDKNISLEDIDVSIVKGNGQNKVKLIMEGNLEIEEVQCKDGDEDLIKKTGNRYTYGSNFRFRYLKENEEIIKDIDVEFVFNKKKKSAKLEIKVKEELNLGMEPQGEKFNRNSPGYSPAEVEVIGSYRSFVEIEFDDTVTLFHLDDKSGKKGKLKVELETFDDEIILKKFKKRSNDIEDTGNGIFYINGSADILDDQRVGKYKGFIDVSVSYD